MDRTFADKLNAHGEEIGLSVTGIHGTNDVTVCTHQTIVCTHPNINAGTKIDNYREQQHTYHHLSFRSDKTSKLKDVKMILDQNCYNMHRPEKWETCTNDEPWAVEKKLEYILCGPLPQWEALQKTPSCVTASKVDVLTEQIKTWWGIDSYASRCNISGSSKKDDKALQMLEQTTTFDGERYEVSHLWKRNDHFLPNNYSTPLSPMKSLEYRLEKKPELRKLYRYSIKVDVEKGFIRILKQEELDETTLETQWYVL